jgi:hypothetical protein
VHHEYATADQMPTYGTIMQLERRVEDNGHRLYVANYSILQLLTYLITSTTRKLLIVIVFSITKFWSQGPEKEEMRYCEK